MSMTTHSLTRAGGVSAVAAGLLFIAVEINHPPLLTAATSLKPAGVQ